MSLLLPMVLVLVALALYASVVATSSAFMPNQASLPDNGDTVRRTADANPWGEDPNRLTALRLVVTALTLVVAGTASVQIGDYISVPSRCNRLDFRWSRRALYGGAPQQIWAQ